MRPMSSLEVSAKHATRPTMGRGSEKRLEGRNLEQSEVGRGRLGVMERIASGMASSQTESDRHRHVCGGPISPVLALPNSKSRAV